MVTNSQRLLREKLEKFQRTLSFQPVCGCTHAPGFGLVDGFHVRQVCSTIFNWVKDGKHWRNDGAHSSCR